MVNNNSISGGRVKEILVENGITQKKFAEQIYMSQKHLSNIINGHKALTLRNADIIAGKFPGVRPEWLLGFDDFKTEDEYEEYIGKTLDTVFKDDDMFNALFEAVGYNLVGAKADFVVPEKDRELMGADVLSDCLVGYKFTHEGNVSGIFEKREIDKLQEEILDFTKAWIERYIREKGGLTNANE